MNFSSFTFSPTLFPQFPTWIDTISRMLKLSEVRKPKIFTDNLGSDFIQIAQLENFEWFKNSFHEACW